MRTRLFRALSLLVAFAVGSVPLLLATPAAATLPYASPVTSQLTRDQIWQSDPQISGDRVVWEDDRTGNGDIYMYDKATAKETRLTNSSDWEAEPAIDGNHVVYMREEGSGSASHREIWMLTLPSLTPVRLSDGDSNDKEGPRVDGKYIVWTKYMPTSSKLLYYDLAHPGASHQIPLTGQYAAGWPRDADVSDMGNGYVVFNYDNASGHGQWGLYVISPAPPAPSTPWPTSTDLERPRIDGLRVVWADQADGQIHTCVIGNAASHRLVSSGPSYQTEPDVSGNRVVWRDGRNDSTAGDDVWFCDMDLSAVRRLTAGTTNEGRPAIDGTRVVWENEIHDSHGDWIQGDVFECLLSPVTAYTRFGGADRFATSAAIYNGWLTTRLIVTTGRNWPDALGAAALAGAYGCPVLLCDTNSLPTAVRSRLIALGPSYVYIIGATSVVGDGVWTAIHSALPGATIKRISGATRYETADKVADEVRAHAAFTTAYVATGLNYPDALSAAPLAFGGADPIFLVGPGGLTAQTKTAMAGVTRFVLLGSTSVVPTAVETDLSHIFPGATIVRLQGSDRYQTSAAIGQWGVNNLGMVWGSTGLTIGTNFADALSAGPYMGWNNAPLLLTPGDSLSSAARSRIWNNRGSIHRIVLFGGANVLTDYTKGRVALLLP